MPVWAHARSIARQRGHTVELKRECWSLLLGIEEAIDLLGGCVAMD